MALVLVIVPPVVAAEPQDEGMSGVLVGDTCYAVRPGAMPPVAIYECPSGG